MLFGSPREAIFYRKRLVLCRAPMKVKELILGC